MRYALLPALLLAATAAAQASDAKDPRVDAQVAEVGALLLNFHFVTARPAQFDDGTAADPAKTAYFRGAVPIAGGYKIEPELEANLEGRLRQGIVALRDQLGVKTIVDLETSDILQNAEAQAAREAGVTFILKQLPPLAAKPTASRVGEIMAVLEDPANYPVYVHCRHGEDRTGMVTGLFRVFLDKMAPAAAYSEMAAYGFHAIGNSPWEIGLDCVFREMTGMQKSSICALIPAYDPD